MDSSQTIPPREQRTHLQKVNDDGHVTLPCRPHKSRFLQHPADRARVRTLPTARHGGMGRCRRLQHNQPQTRDYENTPEVRALDVNGQSCAIPSRP